MNKINIIKQFVKHIVVKSYQQRQNRGFTLIEALITIAIFVLALGATIGLILGLYRAHDYTFQQALAISEAKQGVETMVKEIREARAGDDGSYIIESAEDYEFIFFSDIDKDGDTEKIRYFIDGTDFKKAVTEPVGGEYGDEENIFILSKYVRNSPPIFRYYNGNLEELPAPARLSETKLMEVYLVVNVDPNRPPIDFVLENFVQLRNLKTNL